MNYKEAAKILTNRYHNWTMPADPDFEDAIMEGIKALNILIEWEIPIGQTHTARLLNTEVRLNTRARITRPKGIRYPFIRLLSYWLPGLRR